MPGLLRRDWQFAADSRSRHGVSPAAAAHEHQLRYTEARVTGDDPAKTIEQPSNDRVVRRDGGDEAVTPTLLRRIENCGDERGADALPLPVVLNDDGYLRRRLVDGLKLASATTPAQPAPSSSATTARRRR